MYKFLKQDFDAIEDVLFDYLGKPKPLAYDYLALEDKITQLWYESYHDAEDYSFYSRSEYVLSLFYCWKTFTRQNLNSYVKWLAARHIVPSTIFDFHAGFGLGSIQLATEFPNTEIIMHSEVDDHVMLAKKLADHFHVDNITFSKVLVPSQHAVAMETFEHFKRPIEGLESFLTHVNPQVYYDCSSFTITASGHFNHYEIGPRFGGSIEVPRNKIRRLFNQVLREYKYEQYWNVEGCKHPFNGKPNIWVQIA